MNRRSFSKHVTTLGMASLVGIFKSTNAQGTHVNNPAQTSQEPQGVSQQSHEQAMAAHTAFMSGPKLVIGLVVYPGMFLQDLIGPLTVFEALMNKEIHLLWKTLDPVGNEDTKTPALIPVKPTTRFDQCPKHLDVLFVPGGVPGTFTLMEDKVVLDFLARQAKYATFVTSVCTGSLILAAAGLLKGYKATTYWALRDQLKGFGAIPVHSRIVVDGNRITGGGVTAGIDFGLYMVSLLRSKEYAQAVQLYLEYDPAPPFDAGSPEKAPTIVVQFLKDMFVSAVDTVKAIAKRAT